MLTESALNLRASVRLENDYIGGLQRLYDRTAAIDSLHDESV